MSQDPFDKWLKNSVDNVDSKVDIENDWTALSERLSEDKDRRKGAFWWWTGSGIAVVLSLLFFFNPMEKMDIRPSEALISKEKINATNSQSKSQQHSNSEDNVLLNIAQNEVDDNQAIITKTSSSNAINKPIENNQFYALKNNSLDFEANKNTSLNVNNNPTQINQEKDEINAEPLDDHSTISLEYQPFSEKTILEDQTNAPLKREAYAIDFLATSIKGLNTEYSLESLGLKSSDYIKISQPSIWTISLAFSGGVFQNKYRKVDASLAEALNRVETAREVLGLELKVYRKLSQSWSLGAGINIDMHHLNHQQSFRDTTLGKMSQQVIRTIEHFDGQITSVYGAGNGQFVYDVGRDNHQVFWSLTLPVSLRKSMALSKNMSLGLEAGISPQYYLHRQGNAIIGSERDLALQSLESRYTSSFGASIQLGGDLTWKLSPVIDVFSGIFFQKQVLGQSSTLGQWQQYMDDGRIKIGLRLHL